MTNRQTEQQIGGKEIPLHPILSNSRIVKTDEDYVNKQGLRHRGGGTGGRVPLNFESAGDNPPIFRKIVGQIR